MGALARFSGDALAQGAAITAPGLSASAIQNLAPRRTRLTKTFGGGVILKAAGLTGIVPYTFLYVVPIEAPCYAARVGFLNPFNVNMTIAKLRFYPTDTYTGCAAAQVAGTSNQFVTITGAGISAIGYFDNTGSDLPTPAPRLARWHDGRSPIHA